MWASTNAGVTRAPPSSTTSSALSAYEAAVGSVPVHPIRSPATSIAVAGGSVEV